MPSGLIASAWDRQADRTAQRSHTALAALICRSAEYSHLRKMSTGNQVPRAPRCHAEAMEKPSPLTRLLDSLSCDARPRPAAAVTTATPGLSAGASAFPPTCLLSGQRTEMSVLP
jgi:hypothetical protein